MITRPLLAASIVFNKADLYDHNDRRRSSCGMLDELRYPLIASPKVDGIRCVIVNNDALSRSFKPIPNRYVRNYLQLMHLEGYDGELTIPGATFNEVQSAIMSVEGEPDFRFLVFDNWNHELYDSYIHREDSIEGDGHRVFRLDSRVISNKAELLTYEHRCWQDGYEGICLRDPRGRYKCGRSTFREHLLIKLKRTLDDEATVIDCRQLFQNNNEQETNELGLSKRSKAQDGLVGLPMVGALVVSHPTFGEFEVGSGFTEDQRREMWTNFSDYRGRSLTFRYQPYGVKDKPRCPRFKGWRNPLDQ